VRVARLFKGEAAIYSDKLAELWDVRFGAMNPLAFTLNGVRAGGGRRVRAVVAAGRVLAPDS